MPRRIDEIQHRITGKGRREGLRRRSCRNRRRGRCCACRWVKPLDFERPRTRHGGEIDRKCPTVRRVNQILRSDRRSLSQTLRGGTQRTLWCDVRKIQLAGVRQNVTEVVAEVVPARVRTRTNSIHRRRAVIPRLPRVRDVVRVHKQDLISIRKILPGIVPIELSRIVPHPEIAVVRIIDVDLTARRSASAACCG